MSDDKREKITAWVTAYALTQGIIKVGGATVCHNVSSGMLDTNSSLGYQHGRDWHRTEGAAILRAEEMRMAKIAALERQIERLRALSFEPVATARGKKARG